jgi:hypothetical protein
MFEQCIKESKPRPDFSGTDDHQVSLTLRGEVQDVRFLQFLEKLGAERVSQLSTYDLLILDYIHAERRIPSDLRPRISLLVDIGVIEPAGHGRYTLSRRFYDFLGKEGHIRADADWTTRHRRLYFSNTLPKMMLRAVASKNWGRFCLAYPHDRFNTCCQCCEKKDASHRLEQGKKEDGFLLPQSSARTLNNQPNNAFNVSFHCVSRGPSFCVYKYLILVPVSSNLKLSVSFIGHFV